MCSQRCFTAKVWQVGINKEWKRSDLHHPPSPPGKPVQICPSFGSTNQDRHLTPANSKLYIQIKQHLKIAVVTVLKTQHSIYYKGPILIKNYQQTDVCNIHSTCPLNIAVIPDSCEMFSTTHFFPHSFQPSALFWTDTVL